MKQKILLIICTLLFVLPGWYTAYAQTKCPPKRSFFKEKKQRGALIKFPVRYKEISAKKLEKQEPAKEKTVKAKLKKEKAPDYRVERVNTVKVKMRKVRTGDYASTKCPH